MPTPQFIPLSLEEFRKLVERFDFSTRRIDSVHMHHTWRPRQQDFRGLASILAMWQFHTETQGWSDIAQHVTIDPQGIIWTGRSWRLPPASHVGHNGTSRAGPFMFETVGDFDTSQEKLQGKQREAVIGVITAIQQRNGLSPESLRFHRQLGSPKTCPGSGISHEAILAEVRAAHADAAPRRGRGVSVKGKKGKSTAPLTPSIFVQDESRIAAALQLMGTATRATEVLDTGMEEVEGALELDRSMTSGSGLVERAPGARDTDAAFDAAALARLRPHVVNLVQGEFLPTGIYQTSKTDVDAIFQEHLAERLAQATEAKPLHLMLWAHGGLVSERNGLRGAGRMLDWWLANGVYPIHFIWETGAMETIKQIVSRAGSRAPDVAARDLWDYTTDPLVELLSRPFGTLLWAAMKRSAERASAAGADGGGGARYVAAQVAKLVKGHGKRVRVHAAGHSAGSIFHAYLVPALIEMGVTLESLHFLAPAVRIDTFLVQLRSHLMQREKIRNFTMFTMSRDWERSDDCARIYRKSLLYLVSLAFEPERKTPLLGLEEFVRESAPCREIFGLDGKRAKGEVIWSRSAAHTGRYASRSTSHGAFDDDPATLNSMLRRVLGEDDVATIVEYEAPAGGRAVDDEEEELPAELALFLRPPQDEADSEGSDGEATAQPEQVSPVKPPGTGGRRYALCVGINKYRSRPLEGCVADAQAWARVLKQLGFGAVRTLFDQAATRQAILGGLEKLVTEARAGDIIVFQYAGHGTQLPDDDSKDEKDDQDEALCPVDYDKGRFVIDDDIKRIFANLPAGVNLTCFFDCCHSGTITRLAARQSGRAMGVRGEAARPRYLPPTAALIAKYRAERKKAPRREAPMMGMRAMAGGNGKMHEVVFTACRADQVAYESGGHGDFTRIASELLQASSGRESHTAFLARIRHGFGAQARQEPQLDCAREMHESVLLGPVAADS